MPKDTTGKKEKKEKKEKKQKEVVEEAPPTEPPTTDVPEDVEVDNVEPDTKAGFFIRSIVGRSRSCTPISQVTKKPKREKKEEQGEVVVPMEELSPIAHPIARKKLLRKLNKAVKKGASPFVFFCQTPQTDTGNPASKARQVKRGVKEVVKGIRKGEKG